MENRISTINVAQKLSKTLSSRDILEVLVKEIKSVKEKQVNLDFREVELISRSVAHELLKIQVDFERKKIFKKIVNFVNTNEEVSKMLRIVASNLALPNSPKPMVNAEVVDINKLVKDFG